MQLIIVSLLLFFEKKTMSGSSLFKFIAPAFLSIVLLVCCKQPTTQQESVPEANGVKYATGFTISEEENFTVIGIVNPESNTKNELRYALAEKDVVIKNPDSYDAVLRIPLNKIVVTSTTHIRLWKPLAKKIVWLVFLI